MNQLPNRRQTHGVAWLLLFGLFLFLVTVPIWMISRAHCYPYFDFGIYSQAIANFSLHDLNPWVSGRQVYIFNDHFDPILLSAMIFEPWLGAPSAGLLTETLFVLASAAVIIWLHNKGLLSRRNAWLMVLLLLFNPGVLEALHFPIHPTTWAVAPFVLLFAALQLRRPVLLLAALALLFSCKEEFPFVGVMVAFYLLHERRWRLGAAALALSLGWIVFDFYWRAKLFGPAVAYNEKLFAGLAADPAHYFWHRLTSRSMWSRLGSLLIVMAPLSFWAWRGKPRPDLRLVAFILPLFLIRFFGMAWRHHYNACLMAGAIAAFLPVLVKRQIPKWVFAATLLFLISTNSNKIKFAYQAWTSDATRFTRYCPASPERLASVNAGIDYLKEHPEGRALIGQNLATHLAYRPEIYSVAGPQDATLQPFQYVLVEKPPMGNAWPLTHERLNELIAGWRDDFHTRVLIDDKQIFFAAGEFHSDR